MPHLDYNVNIFQPVFHCNADFLVEIFRIHARPGKWDWEPHHSPEKKDGQRSRSHSGSRSGSESPKTRPKMEETKSSSSSPNDKEKPAGDKVE